jgi:hypothetical protein
LQKENILRRGKDMEVLFEILGIMAEATVGILLDLIPRHKRKKKRDVSK